MKNILVSQELRIKYLHSIENLIDLTVRIIVVL